MWDHLPYRQAFDFIFDIHRGRKGERNAKQKKSRRLSKKEKKKSGVELTGGMPVARGIKETHTSKFIWLLWSSTK
jgi:hypothetical protein